MLATLARGCPPGPFPGWCDATWATYSPVTSPATQACLPWPAGGPISFGPGTCYTFGPAAVHWWDLPHLGIPAVILWIAAGLAIAIAIDLVTDWFRNRYEIGDLVSPRPFRRRWYGRNAEVRLRYDAPSHPDRPGLFFVLDWADEHTAVPCLLVENIDDTFGVEAFWAPVTDFVPHAVRRIRPHFLRYGMRNHAVLIPWLTEYRPLRQPTGYLGSDA